MTDNHKPTNPVPAIDAQPTESPLALEATLQQMVEDAGVEHVRSVLRTDDGRYVVHFTRDGYPVSARAVALIKEHTPLKISEVNGKTITVIHIPSYPVFAVGDTVIRKSDGVAIAVTATLDECLSGKGVNEATGEIVEVEMVHRKHFALAEAGEGEAVREKTEGDGLVEWIGDQLDAAILSERQTEPITTSDPVEDTVPAPLTPAERFALSAYADHKTLNEALEAALTIGDPSDPPDDEPDVEEDNTTPLPAAALLKIIAAKDAEIAALKTKLDAALKTVDKLTESVEQLIGDVERALEINQDLGEMLVKKQQAVVTVEADQDDDCVPALYAKRINTGWKVACQQYEGVKLRAMWVREVRTEDEGLRTEKSTTVEDLQRQFQNIERVLSREGVRS